MRFDEITIENVKRVINSLTTTKRHRPLSDSYKRNIFQYIVREKLRLGDNNWRLDKTQRARLGFTSPRKRIVLTEPMFSFLVNATQYAILWTPDMTVVPVRSWFDLIIAIIMITTTSCRVPALTKLLTTEIETLVRTGESSSVRKSAYFDYVYEHILNLIQLRNTSYSEELSQVVSGRPLNEHIVTCKSDILNKRLQELFVQRMHADTPDYNLGLSFFRKANFDELSRAVWSPTFITSLTELQRPVPTIHFV